MGSPFPAPPTLRLNEVKDPAAREALMALLIYIDLLRRQIERDYS